MAKKRPVRKERAEEAARRVFYNRNAISKRKLYREEGEIVQHVEQNDTLYDGRGRFHASTYQALIQKEEPEENPEEKPEEPEEVAESPEDASSDSVVSHYILVANLMKLNIKEAKAALRKICPDLDQSFDGKAELIARLSFEMIGRGISIEDLEGGE